MESHLFIYDYVCLVGGEKLKKLEIFPAAAP